MNELPKHLKYAESHEWVKVEENQVIRVGITDFAQQELGDLVNIELPDIGRRFDAGEQCAVVESVKSASDLFSPLSGEITAVNDTLKDAPEQVNDDPYQTWLFCLKAGDLSELDRLMDAAAYQAMITE